MLALIEMYFCSARKSIGSLFHSLAPIVEKLQAAIRVVRQVSGIGLEMM